MVLARIFPNDKRILPLIMSAGRITRIEIGERG